jgi:tetrahydromethanopterin S-methyltransferase subunit C
MSYYLVWSSGEAEASTKYNLQHGVPSSGFVSIDIGSLLSFSNRFSG